MESEATLLSLTLDHERGAVDVAHVICPSGTLSTKSPRATTCKCWIITTSLVNRNHSFQLKRFYVTQVLRNRDGNKVLNLFLLR